MDKDNDVYSVNWCQIIMLCRLVNKSMSMHLNANANVSLDSNANAIFQEPMQMFGVACKGKCFG